MGKVLLSDFAGELVARLPLTPCRCRDEKVKAEHFTFSADNLPGPPPLLATSDLVMSKSDHQYGNCCRIDVVHFYASGKTHRELGVLILSALFSKKSQRVVIELEHEASSVKRLEINWRGSSQGSCWDYTRQPEKFDYHPEIPERIPWNWPLDERDLPMFDLDFREGSQYHPVNDMDKRDRVEVRGSDDALVLVADLLLNIGLPACDSEPAEGSPLLEKTYILESFLGYQRVAKWSAEARFHLPNSFSWPGEHPRLSR